MLVKVHVLNFYTVCFYCIPSWGLSKYIETELQTTFFYLIYRFSENKKRSGTILLASFSAWFLKKDIPVIPYRYNLSADQISFSGCLFFVRYCAVCAS